MGINKFNSEGYYDPTTYEALTNIAREEKAAKRVYRPLVYICSPYAGEVEWNVNMARVYSRFAVRNACIPLASHLLYPQFMDDGNPAELCSVYGAGAAYEMRPGVGVWQEDFSGDGGGDRESGKEEDSGAVFYRRDGGG